MIDEHYCYRMAFGNSLKAQQHYAQRFPRRWLSKIKFFSEFTNILKILAA